MGLKLSNESVLCVEQICPLLPGTPTPRPLNKCQVKRVFLKGVVDTACSLFNWTNQIGSAYAATWTPGAHRQFEVTSRCASISATSTSQRVQRSSYRHKLWSKGLYRWVLATSALSLSLPVPIPSPFFVFLFLFYQSGLDGRTEREKWISVLTQLSVLISAMCWCNY